jgi:hypothetical protein
VPFGVALPIATSDHATEAMQSLWGEAQSSGSPAGLAPEGWDAAVASARAVGVLVSGRELPPLSSMSTHGVLTSARVRLPHSCDQPALR